MNTERELLEAAARAAGMLVLSEREQWPDECIGWFYREGPGWGALWNRAAVSAPWNPRHSKEQSMDLMAALRISVEHDHPHEPCGWVIASINGGKERVCFLEDVPAEELRADRMRLAILRCAAAQAPAVGVETAENGSKSAGNGVAAGSRRGGEACPR